MPDDLPVTHPKDGELQAALRDMDQLVQQMRSQRDVARNQCEQLQRRWRQQVEQIEQRLSESQRQCERLQRELDEATHPAEPSVPEPSPEIRPMGGSGLVSGSNSWSPSSGSPHRLPSLRQVIQRLQQRATGEH